MTSSVNNKASARSMIPPAQFSLVETGIFRSAYPTQANIPFLLRSGIKTIALLSIEALPVSVARALADTTTNVADANPTAAGAGGVGAPNKLATNSAKSMMSVSVEQHSNNTINPSPSTLAGKSKATLMSPLLSPNSNAINSSGGANLTPAIARGSGVETDKAVTAKGQTGIRVVEVADLRSWKNDATNGRDDFSQRDIQRALDLAVNARWHPILFCCPTGELQTSVLVGCMRRYQLWPLSSIYSECELFLSMCKTVRPSVLYFISIWNPNDYPITITDVKFRDKMWNMMGRMETMKKKDPCLLSQRSLSARSPTTAKAARRGRPQERSSVTTEGNANSSSCSDNQSLSSDSSDHSTTPTTTDHVRSDLSVRSPTYDAAGKYVGQHVTPPDNGTGGQFPSTEKGSLPALKPSASAATLASASLVHGWPRASGASRNGVRLAAWMVRALQLEADLDAYVADMHGKAFRQNIEASASFPSSAETAADDALPPPHVRFAGFQLALPTESIFGEVQVQQKNELDVNSFFINVDDATVSPMITTDPSFGRESVKRGPLSPQPSPSSAVGKFFHVNNTNIFVLMDGISMFFEGKSTFEGDDPLAVQKAVQRKRRNMPEHASSGSGMNGATEDTVEAAIRGIQEEEGQTSRRVEENGAGPQLQNATAIREAATGAGARTTLRSQVTNTSLNLSTCLPSRPSSKLTDFFKDAVRPHNPAPFGKLTVRMVREPEPTASPSALSSSTSHSQAASKCSPTAYSPTASRRHESGLSYVPSSTDLFNRSVSSAVSITSKNSDMYSTNLTLDGATAHKPYSTAATTCAPKSPRRGHRRTKHKKSFVSEKDIGMSNRSLDLDDVEVLNFIGVGTQGKVYRVMVDGMLYAMKRIDVKEATEAANSIERQGRKRGLVKELNMIRLQRSKKPPQYLMSMFNAVATVDNERQHLSVLMELMSFSVEDVQHMVARIPQTELNKITQSSFKNHLGGTNTSRWLQEVDTLMKQHPGSCMHVLGRSAFNHLEEWEYPLDRQTMMHEIILSMLACDVLRGLAELHQDYNIVHCDLKPANILLAFDMQHFKLTDFGCGSVMDPVTGKVRRRGVDLGSKLYKPPERLMSRYALRHSNESNDWITGTAAEASFNADDGGEGDETFEGCDEVVEFTAKADVWSLGILLLELAAGVHPCQPFKSDYWNYVNLLKLSRMSKPPNWSGAFCDFIVRCVNVDVHKRWSVQNLQAHPFITKYENVPRNKLKVFMQKLESESANFQRKQQKEIVEEQIRLSTMSQARDNYKKRSIIKWRSFTGFLRVAPQPTDTQKFPQLDSI